MHYIRNIINRFLFKIIIHIINKKRVSTVILEFLFKNYSKNFQLLTGLSPYFANFDEKKILLEKIKIYQARRKLLFNIPINQDDKKIISTLNMEGITNKLSLSIPKKEVLYVNNYFHKKNYYDFHMPIKSKKKNANTKPESAYMSYDYNDQLNCLPILKLCLNKRVISIAEKYLETFPILYSVNTFRTLPKKAAFTHGFHRDVENLKMLVFFVFWTDTNKNDGAFEQINYTHKPSKELSNTLLKHKNLNLLPSNVNDFFKSTTSYGDDIKYLEVFNKDDIFSSYGKSGHIATADTFGIHRGTPVKTPRLVTWIRFGAIQERGTSVKSSDLENNISLTGECYNFYKNSKYNSVLDKLLLEK